MIRITAGRQKTAGLFLGFLLAVLATNIMAVDAKASTAGIERILNEISLWTNTPLPSAEAIKQSCGMNMVCAARMLAEAMGPDARLTRQLHPDTDTIRMVRNLPSITRIEYPGTGILRVRFTRFGRTAIQELETALMTSRQVIRTLEVDLRDHRGGNLRAMMRLASWFTGPVHKALALQRTEGKLEWLDLNSFKNGASELPRPHIRILINQNTASSAEIFAALLRRYAGARILGNSRTRGKNWLLRTIAVTHDLVLLVPAERIHVPGESLTGGLLPDAPFPPADRSKNTERKSGEP